jgi:CHAD domain-containing protein
VPVQSVSDSRATAARPRAFRLHAGESIPHAARRIATHELETIQETLEGNPWATESVHEIRKSTKRLRALVRLLREAMGEDAFQTENVTFRDLGRLFSEARDAAVLRTSAADSKSWSDGLRTPARQAAARVLRSRARLIAAAGEQPARIERAREAVRHALARVENWSRVPDGWEVIAVGLRRTYRRAGDCKSRVVLDPSDKNLHEWRKRTKDLRYCIELLEPIWPRAMTPLGETLHELTDLLGDDHDLAMLPRYFADEDVSQGLEERVTALVAGRRQELQACARGVGDYLYAERPRAFCARLAGYWHVWRQQEE